MGNVVVNHAIQLLFLLWVGAVYLAERVAKVVANPNAAVGAGLVVGIALGELYCKYRCSLGRWVH